MISHLLCRYAFAEFNWKPSATGGVGGGDKGYQGDVDKVTRGRNSQKAQLRRESRIFCNGKENGKKKGKKPTLAAAKMFLTAAEISGPIPSPSIKLTV